MNATESRYDALCRGCGAEIGGTAGELRGFCCGECEDACWDRETFAALHVEEPCVECGGRHREEACPLNATASCTVCGNPLAADERGACDHHLREEAVHGYGRDAEY